MRVLDHVTRAMFALACVALLAMLGAYLAEVVLRYGFDAPTRWSSDVVSYALLLAVAFALPAVTRDGGHVAITSLVERLAPDRRRQAQRALAVLSALVCAAGAALLLVQALAQHSGGIETVAAMPVPKWWLSTAVAAGFAGASLEFARAALAQTAAPAT